MATIDPVARTARIRIVLWGSPGAGKRSVLAYLARISEQNTGKPPASDAPGQLRYSFGEKMRGFAIETEFVIVEPEPGALDGADGEYAVAGALDGADGVYAVADGLDLEASRVAFSRLRDVAAQSKRTLSARDFARVAPHTIASVCDGLPVVVLYNKCDLADAVPEQRMREALNPEGFEDFGGVARTGVGVGHLAMRVVKLALLNLLASGLLRPPKSRRPRRT